MRHALQLSMLCAALSACGNSAVVQCDQNAGCDLFAGGMCASASSGNKWCSYPDADCPSGYRFSTFQVGDGLSGVCAPAEVATDAGITPDSPDGQRAQAARSCEGLAKSCGPSSSEDCCTALRIPSGTYFRSYDSAAAAGSGDKSAPATVSAFAFDKYEVTVGRFRAFLAANQGTQAIPPGVGAGAHPNLIGSGWSATWNSSLAVDTLSLSSALKCNKTLQTWTEAPGANENLPITCVTWYEAMAFCAWDGGFLPTESEWNYAAAGGDEQRAYPWSAPPSSLAIDASRANYCGLGCSSATAKMLPVGTKTAGDGRWGHSDLAGNVREWTLDWYAAYGAACSDCANLVADAYRVIRGGSVSDDADHIRTGYRDLHVDSTLRIPQAGLRCARMP